MVRQSWWGRHCREMEQSKVTELQLVMRLKQVLYLVSSIYGVI